MDDVVINDAARNNSVGSHTVLLASSCQCACARHNQTAGPPRILEILIPPTINYLTIFLIHINCLYKAVLDNR